MKVFLTGASGFLGAYVLRRLLLRGQAEVAVLVRERSHAWRIADELPQVRIVEADLADATRLGAALSTFRPTHLVHLAWTGVLGRNRNDAGQHANAAQGMRLIELALDAGTRHVIGIGSQAEYGPCSSRIDESTPTRPTTMYGAAKLATCVMASQLCALRDARFAWLRLFSSYGPMDHEDWMIPYVTRTLLRRERPSTTRAEQRWDYVYVDDAAQAVVRVVETATANGIFNLGSGHAVPLREVIERVRDEIDPELPIGFGEVPYRPDQVMHLEADVGRLARVTGWAPRTQLSAGIRATVEWYRAHDDRH